MASRQAAAFGMVVAGLLFLLLAGREATGATTAQRALLVEWTDAAPIVRSTVPAEEFLPPATDYSGPRTDPPRELSQGEPLFLLEIPRIGVSNVVVYGSSDEALNRGPGLLERTALPGGPGNAVVGAHRDYYFWRLGELTLGDQVMVSGPAGSWTYVVQSSRVVKETETQILAPTAMPTITLFTCWPLIFAGRSPDRLVVTAVLQDFISSQGSNQ